MRISKNHKLIQTIILSLIILSLLSITVIAHSGKNDANGGHYDHSSGEYHYHHGYSAHSHYDIDGDGDIDCPYSFDDKTDNGNNSGSNSGASNQNIGKIEKTPEKDKTDDASQTIFENIENALLIIVILLVLFLLIERFISNMRR